jgi:hypothetical protein
VRVRKRNDVDPSSIAPLVATGSIRIPRETQPLAVTLAFTANEVSLNADEVELGTWRPDEVQLSRVDALSFSFVAEGDRLVFRPDDAESFAIHPLVARALGESEPASPRKRKVAVKRDAASSEPVARSVDEQPSKSADIETRSAEGDPPETKESLWLRTVDTARRNGLFGLDRIPVPDEDRDQEHQHTYEHKAAAQSGPGKHICAICGKIRL